MKHGLKRAGDCLRDLLLPPKCAGCRQLLQPFVPDPDFLCPLCRTAFAASGQACRLRFPDIVHDIVPDAADPDGKRPAVHAALCLYDPADPDGVPQRVIYRIKHNRDRRVFDGLGRALAARVRSCLADAGIPADRVICAYPPRKAASVRREGVDQAKELAERTAACLGVPCVPLFVRAGRSGAVQKELNAADRKAQASGTYCLNAKRAHDAAGMYVILVDDVCTTGATLDALSVLAREAGAAGTVRVTVGRTAERE